MPVRVSAHVSAVARVEVVRAVRRAVPDADVIDDVHLAVRERERRPGGRTLDRNEIARGTFEREPVVDRVSRSGSKRERLARRGAGEAVERVAAADVRGSRSDESDRYIHIDGNGCLAQRLDL